MDCKRFEDLLFESLDAPVVAVDKRLMQEHEHGCTRCRDLASLMRDEVATATAEVPADLAATVMQRTSGSPCDRAQLLLARAEEGLAEDGGLLALHLGGCPECAAMARALVHLRTELPCLAELDPGAGFVAGVMAATVGTAQPVGESFWSRAAETWERLAQRPRLALEGAYATALVVLLVFGLPSASFAELPARAFDGVRQEGIKVERVVSDGLGDLAALGRATWAESTSRATEFLAGAESTRAGTAFVDQARAWAVAAQRMATAVWDTLLAPIIEDLANLWNRSTAAEAETSAPQ